MRRIVANVRLDHSSLRCSSSSHEEVNQKQKCFVCPTDPKSILNLFIFFTTKTGSSAFRGYHFSQGFSFYLCLICISRPIIKSTMMEYNETRVVKPVEEVEDSTKEWTRGLGT